jgi:uncharacterized protein YbjT (DUF2867 family)
MGKTAIIVGATGLVGRVLTDQLIRHKDFSQLHVLVRKEINFGDSEKLNIHIVNFDDEKTYPIIPEADTVFCCLGTTIKKAGSQENFITVDLTYVYRIGKHFQGLGASHFIVISAVGANKDAKLFYNRVKGEMEEKIASLQFPHTIIMRPAMLGGKRNEFRFGEWIGSCILKAIQWLFMGKMRRYKIISAEKVANAMLCHALENKSQLLILESEKIQEY